MVTHRWTTIATVGFSAAVSWNENRAAHGGVCHLQARRTRNGTLVGRKINSNGRHQEVSETFELHEPTLEEWKRIAASSK